MKRFLIKIAYKILQYYSVETLPYFYSNGCEYEVISAEIHPVSGYLIIKAEEKSN
jgi:hypothetical protein